MGLKRSLTFVDIVLMNLVAVTSLRWIASAASSGQGSILLWLLAATLFFLPEGLAVAELSSRYPGEGGLYRWTQRAFGEGHGFVCGWCYWVNNLIYFPGLLLYVAASLAFTAEWLVPGSHLESNKGFVVAITLGTLWLVAGLSFVGMQAGKWLQNAGGLANWIPACLVAVLGGLCLALYGSANPFPLRALVPRLTDPAQLSFFAQMCFALAGLELVSFLGGEIRDPRRTITRALLVSGLLILFVYVLGTLGVLVSVPKDKITPVNGLLLPLQEMGNRWRMPWIAGVSGALVALGGIGTTMAWFAGASRVPYLVGVDRYLPRSFGNLHPRFQTPGLAILVQAGLATAVTLFATAGASTKMEAAYKVLVDMCLILYFIPYCYLFLSLFKLRNEPVQPGLYRVPGGAFGNAAASLVGFATTLLAIATTLYPGGDSIDWSLPLRTIVGTAIFLLAGLGFYARGRRVRVHARPFVPVTSR